jgi:hypothetical protein
MRLSNSTGPAHVCAEKHLSRASKLQIADELIRCAHLRVCDRSSRGRWSRSDPLQARRRILARKTCNPLPAGMSQWSHQSSGSAPRIECGAEIFCVLSA